MDQPAPIVILGTGYTGRFIYSLGSARGLTILAGSRAPDKHLASLPAAHRLRFDLEQPTTWTNIPERAKLIWCFPATPEDLVRDFASQVAPRIARLVVLGSTSAYDPAARHTEGIAPLIDEDSPLDMTLPRVRGEEYLRSHCRTPVLRCAGIYGPGRHVLDWIRQGRVTASTRYVNLIHVEDLACICLEALERGKDGSVYNVSDGQPRQWSEIVRTACERWGVTQAEGRERGKAHGPGKRLSIAKLQRDFTYRFLHPDLYAALDAIEKEAR